MTGLIAIVVVVAVLIFAGSAVYKEEKPPASVSTQDSEFLGWASETLEQLDVTLLIEAEERYDSAAVYRYSGMLYNDAYKALSEIDQFSVSPKLQPSKDEFKLMLQDLKYAMYYTERGARNTLFKGVVDPYNIKTGTEYLQSYNKHLKRVNALLKRR